MNKTKTILLLVFILSVFSFSFAGAEGLVPCGNDPGDPCTFEDIFGLIDKVVEFILFKLVPPLAVLWFTIAGITMMTAQGDPGKFAQGQKMIKYAVIGVLLVYSAYFLTVSFIKALGGDEGWTLFFFKDTNSIK